MVTRGECPPGCNGCPDGRCLPDELEARAREQIQSLIDEGYAKDLMATWSYCEQSCNYVYRIVEHVAEEGTTLSAQDFARNLLDDWSK